MNFDIIVPAYAECEGIDLTLDSIAKQTYPNFKTHVCFDCVAPDRERDIMREYKGAMDLSFHRSQDKAAIASGGQGWGACQPGEAGHSPSAQGA